ncbi:very-short-patch-repair endonuclease [Rhizobium aquaticum]|uniref:Very-short-patch-repair endonuclease n=1 Tax=Rhizobium aquaticum TaxID=1549636 RepID=A0ABV2IXN9_9HYPH
MPHHEPPERHRRHARSMRKEGTRGEAILWSQLKDRRIGGIKFRRQVPLKGYIIDFISFEARLIVEVDGSQHAESAADRIRDEAFAADGFVTLRFWNDEVEQSLDLVVRKILMALDKPI